jgi:hypothetical protein
MPPLANDWMQVSPLMMTPRHAWPWPPLEN